MKVPGYGRATRRRARRGRANGTCRRRSGRSRGRPSPRGTFRRRSRGPLLVRTPRRTSGVRPTGTRPIVARRCGRSFRPSGPGRRRDMHGGQRVVPCRDRGRAPASPASWRPLARHGDPPRRGNPTSCHPRSPRRRCSGAASASRPTCGSASGHGTSAHRRDRGRFPTAPSTARRHRSVDRRRNRRRRRSTGGRRPAAVRRQPDRVDDVRVIGAAALRSDRASPHHAAGTVRGRPKAPCSRAAAISSSLMSSTSCRISAVC